MNSKIEKSSLALNATILKNNIKKRIKVLEFSLTLEWLASFSLAYLLDIESDKIKDSKSLGNSSSSLSFNQKVNLLLDNKSITKEEKLKLESFMNIRNQFMHNKDADSYEKAIENIIGLKNRLKNFYPKVFNETNIEIALENCVINLYNDSLKILIDFKGGREKKMNNEVERIVYTKRFNILEKVMVSELDKVLESLKEHSSESMKREELISKFSRLKYEIILKVNAEISNE